MAKIFKHFFFVPKKNRKKTNKENRLKRQKQKPSFSVPEDIKRWLGASLLFLLAIITFLSFFGLAGVAGKAIRGVFGFAVGRAVFIIPLLLAFAALIFLKTKYQPFGLPLALGLLFIFLGVAGVFGTLALENGQEANFGVSQAGLIGYYLGKMLFKLFGFLVAQIIFVSFLVIGLVVLQKLLTGGRQGDNKQGEEESQDRPLIIRKIFPPSFRTKQIAVPKKLEQEKTETVLLEKAKLLEENLPIELSSYKLPPTDLLEPDKENPSSGDIQANTAIIHKTLNNFDIPVEMSEVNIGPTVTQYTLKPAEGVRLSKITALTNDLSLSLAAHPLRVEAPIPGRSLVGIEVPNKVRARVRLKNLVEHPDYQNSLSRLLVCLGRDVSGQPFYADLARMPHLLVAGATGTGKTIFLNSLILSLLYKNPPDCLKLIMVDPKRVEFQVYHNLPHLLAPVIFDAAGALNALKWLIAEMERRFVILAKVKARDIDGYNEIMSKNYTKNHKKTKKSKTTSLAEETENPEEEDKSMPYIVLIIDELADLMSAKGKELEAGIVRLAQMARAVGIHLVLATQRPSVEVITGLIKANITSRITFQVASQIDSRTIIDTSGAEKLLGFGDLLFISADVSKPKRIQGAYVFEKEVKAVVDFINSQVPEPAKEEIEFAAKEDQGPISLASMADSLTQALNTPEQGGFSMIGDDSLYQDAKRVVIESKKASASLLQRRLRIGYARAARLIDMLEEQGVVGPADGAKPREVYLLPEDPLLVREEMPTEINGTESSDEEEHSEGEKENWQKI